MAPAYHTRRDFQQILAATPEGSPNGGLPAAFPAAKPDHIDAHPTL